MADTAATTAGSPEHENLEQEESDEYSDFGEEEEEESSQEDQGSSGEDEDEAHEGGLTALLLGGAKAEKEEEEEEEEVDEYVVPDKPEVETTNIQAKKRRINDVNTQGPSKDVHNEAEDDDGVSKRARV